ncbi:hypothetical protein ACEWY4_021845 [Coilia grayii]|uniref:SOCS box domain-containing protein n=1 Tax=Coilia grayii TaxID=363190 RepID=A0ABD1J4B5_9TELE
MQALINKYSSPSMTSSSVLSNKIKHLQRKQENDHLFLPGDNRKQSLMNKYSSPLRSTSLEIPKITKHDFQNRQQDSDYYSPGDTKRRQGLMNKYSPPLRSTSLEIPKTTKHEFQNRKQEHANHSSPGDTKRIGLQALMNKYSSPSPSPSLSTSPSSWSSPLWSTSVEFSVNTRHEFRNRTQESYQRPSIDTKRIQELIHNTSPWWMTPLDSLENPKQVFPEINKVIWANDVGTLREILKYAPLENLTKPSIEGCIHLHEAAYYGFLDCLKELVKAFPDLINKRTMHLQTPLLLAANCKHTNCVECLLQAGADPNLADKLGETPLYLACLRNCEDMVELLLRAGANVGRATLNGLTPLHEAAQHRNLKMCRLLVKAKASVSARSRYGIEPVFAAAQGGCPEVLNFLIRHGANIDAHACDGATPLYEAARNGHEEVVELLLSKGANADEPNDAGLTPLHIAAKNGHARVVSLLITHTNLTSINRNGISPLHLAAESDREDVLEILIAAELDVNSMLSPDRSTLYEDRRSTALFFAVRQDNWDAAYMLLEAGADPNLDVFNPLLLALSRGDRDMVTLLLQYGANVNATVPTHPTTFPGALLFCINNISMLKVLLDNGCDATSCFHCIYGDHPHPEVTRKRTTGYSLHLHGPEAPHTSAAQFCETLADPFYSPWAGPIIDLLLDYVGKVKLCSRLTELLDSNKDWAHIKEKTKPLFSLMHLSRLRIHQLIGRQRMRQMTTLPLPARLIKYLLYDNTESEDFINYGFD